MFVLEVFFALRYGIIDGLLDHEYIYIIFYLIQAGDMNGGNIANGRVLVG